jgi:hypothetical protein
MSKMKMGMAGAFLMAGLLALMALYKWKQLDGQSASWSRVIRTETGGVPTYEPIQYRAKDSREAISDPRFVSANEAKIAGGTMGIGVAIEGEAKFYPLYILAYNQIVNDNCAGVAIACTY